MYEATVKLRVRELRQKSGRTFREIAETFPFLSKSTISEWTRDIELAPDQKERILQKELNGRMELLRYNEIKHQQALDTAYFVIAQAKKEVGILMRRDLLIAGASLYWGEGTKNREMIEIANSDPRLIALMMRFFREILEIPEDKFRCGLMLHPGLDEAEAKDFWSRLTGIPLLQFNKTYIKPPKSSTGKMHNILYRGTVKIRISDVKKKQRIKGFIESLANSTV